LPTNKRRSRTVSFRLSEEEYASLKNISEMRGARSVSEFTRSVACQDNGNGEMNMIEEILRMLHEKIDTIDHAVKRLARAQEIKRKTAGASPENNKLKAKEPIE
jgi:predicted DNA-binding protein